MRLPPSGNEIQLRLKTSETGSNRNGAAFDEGKERIISHEGHAHTQKHTLWQPCTRGTLL